MPRVAQRGVDASKGKGSINVNLAALSQFAKRVKVRFHHKLVRAVLNILEPNAEKYLRTPGKFCKFPLFRFIDDIWKMTVGK